MSPSDSSPASPPGRLPRTVLPKRYQLDITPDLAAARFVGTVVVEVQVHAAVREFVLNAAELTVDGATLVGSDGTRTTGVVAYRADDEELVLTWPNEVGPGAWTLEMRFEGTLNDRLVGLYRSTYQDADGQTAVLAATQFEAADARRAFPCWDEPDMKATFAISLVVDDGLVALSNGPEVSRAPAGPGRHRVTFAETMPMSTYLVALVVGPLDVSLPIEVDGVPVRVVAPPGPSDRYGLALEAARHSLQFFHRYFGIPYPAPKLDHVAIPDFAAGAMENLGCIIYREVALLADPERASEQDKRGVVATVDHETAHMWFGDLVTMRWWNGMWLNEAFASFMQLLATDDWNPRWDVWTEFGRDRAAALRTDGLLSTRPVETAVPRVQDAMGMASVLTYSKGASVLRMMEQYLGADVYRDGIREYLTRHRYGNTETHDLWDALEASSGEPVRDVMDAWVMQGGYPLVSAALDGDGKHLHLSQRRFLYQGADDGRTWRVPVVVGVERPDGGRTTLRTILGAHDETLTLPPDWTFVTVNDGAWGYYRAAYDGPLARRLLANLDTLHPRERVALASDVWASALAGLTPLASAAALWRAARTERDPDVWAQMAEGLSLLDVVASDADRPALAQIVREVAGPALADVGWDAAPDEDNRRTLLRARIIQLLGTTGQDAAVQAEALRRFHADEAGLAPIAPDLVMAVARVVAEAGGATEWDHMRQRAATDPTPQNRVRYLYQLANFSDPALVQRTVAFYLSDDVRTQDSLGALATALSRPAAAATLWDAVEARWDELQAKYPPMSFGYLMYSLPYVLDEPLAARINRWLATHPVGPVQPVVDQAQELQSVHLSFRRHHRGHLAESLNPTAR